VVPFRSVNRAPGAIRVTKPACKLLMTREAKLTTYALRYQGLPKFVY
jgi:hypothetical protein